MIATRVKIRQLKLIDSGRVKKFLEEFNVAVNFAFDPENCQRVKTGPIRKLHSYLPLHWKFLQESYVAVDDKEIIGLIGLIPDGKTRLRWKINQLLLKPNSYEVGKLLIDFIVNKYGAVGVETFLTEVDSVDVDALDLFKNACGFRNCTVKHTYQYKIDGNMHEEADFYNIRRVSITDSSKLYDLYLECLTPQTKVSLGKIASDFNYSLLNTIKEKMNGLTSYGWIVENPDNKTPLAMVNVATRDFSSYFVSIITSLPYAEYYYEILNYVIKHIGMVNSKAVLLINVCEAIQGYSKYSETLKNMGIEETRTNYVLVKDYWQPLKERKPVTAPIIMLPEGTSPACNSLNMRIK